MFKIYLTIAWWTLLKHKAISLIMLIGLSLSMAAFMLCHTNDKFPLHKIRINESGEVVEK
jgi:uncharacterized protein (DUF486 family)